MVDRGVALGQRALAILGHQFQLVEDRALSRDQLLMHTCNRERKPFDRPIDIRIGRLRRKVEPDPTAEPRRIRSVRNGGCMYVPGARGSSEVPCAPEGLAFAPLAIVASWRSGAHRYFRRARRDGRDDAECAKPGARKQPLPNDGIWPLWKDFHNGHYEKTSFMASATKTSALITS